MNLIEFQLTTKDWGKIKFARPAFGSIEHDPWGDLACLKGTPWGDRIPVVPGDLMAHAVHGRATPLMRVIGSPPRALLMQVPDPFRTCTMCKNCISYDKVTCQPSQKLSICYVPPGLDHDQQVAAALVALAWKENRYVVVVQGDEFNL